MSNQQRSSTLYFTSLAPKDKKITGLAIQLEVANKQNWQLNVRKNKTSWAGAKKNFWYKHWKLSPHALSPKTGWALLARVHIIWPLQQPQMSSKDTLHNVWSDPKALKTVKISSFDIYAVCNCWEMIVAEPECCWGLLLSACSPPDLESSLLTSPRLAGCGPFFPWIRTASLPAALNTTKVTSLENPRAWSHCFAESLSWEIGNKQQAQCSNLGFGHWLHWRLAQTRQVHTNANCAGSCLCQGHC